MRWRSIVPILLFVGGCDVLGLSDDQFVVRVDSIVAPPAIHLGDSITAVFHGAVGPDGCSRVESIERHTEVSVVDLRFHGVRRHGSCTQMPAILEHVEKVLPTVRGTFTFRALQPGGSAMVRSVSVE